MQRSSLFPTRGTLGILILISLVAIRVASGATRHPNIELDRRDMSQSGSNQDRDHPDVRAPLALHRANPHYFEFRGKPAVLITSGEHYGSVLNLDFDYHRYLDELRVNRLNLTRTWSGSYREIPESFGITDNTLAPRPNRYICPWARSNITGYFDGGSKFDLTTWDPGYFRRLRDFVKKASDRGIVVEMNLFCPNYDDSLWKASPMNEANNINGVGHCPANEVYTLKHHDLLAVQQAMTRKIVEELREFDNVYYEVCNEPYFGGVSSDWQQQIVSVIVDMEMGYPHKHLISLNVANGSARIEDPIPAVSIYNFHYATPPDAVAINYGLNRVIGDNETGFRGKDNVLYRSEGWEFIMAGGALYNNLDYSFASAHPDGTFLTYKSPGGGSPDLRRQLRILKEFISSFDFVRMRPDKTVVVGGLPEGARIEALVDPGRQYALYLHGGRQANLQLSLPGGAYRVQWRDTLTGKVARTERIRHAGGTASVKSPEYYEDIALSIVATR